MSNFSINFVATDNEGDSTFVVKFYSNISEPVLNKGNFIFDEYDVVVFDDATFMTF